MAFAADINLSTDQAPRLAGRVQIGTTEGDSTTVSVDIAGDIAPLFAADYRAFFGDRVALKSDFTSFADGRLALETLDLKTDFLALNGQFSTDPDGLPAFVDVTGRISARDGSQVLLPLAGPKDFCAPDIAWHSVRRGDQ